MPLNTNIAVSVLFASSAWLGPSWNRPVEIPFYSDIISTTDDINCDGYTDGAFCYLLCRPILNLGRPMPLGSGIYLFICHRRNGAISTRWHKINCWSSVGALQLMPLKLQLYYVPSSYDWSEPGRTKMIYVLEGYYFSAAHSLKAPDDSGMCVHFRI